MQGMSANSGRVDRRAVDRRAVAKGLLWGAPLLTVVSAAPALAVSPAARSTFTAPFTADAYTRESRRRGEGTGLPQGDVTGEVLSSRRASFAASADPTPVTYTVTAIAHEGKKHAVDNLTRVTGVGGSGVSGLLLGQSGGGSDGRDCCQSVTIRFSRPVSDLTFHIAGINRFGRGSNATSYSDQVELTGGHRVLETTDGVGGDGTAASPLHRAESGAADPFPSPADATGTALVTYPGEITEFSVDLWSDEGWFDQTIYLTEMTFMAESRGA